MNRGTTIAIGLLKTSAASGEAVSKALRAGEAAGRAIKGLVGGAGDVGAGVARGLGKSEALGRVGGYGALTAGTAFGAAKAKQKADELKFRTMYAMGMY